MAEGAAKRRRDLDYPRITYNVEERTFDRLFKEETLHEMKGVVRRKLGIIAAVPLTLSQVREGKSVDLEDDDDFEAFYASAYASSMATIQVVVGSDSTTRTGPEDQGSPKKRKKQNQRNSEAGDFSDADTSSVGQLGLHGSPEDLMDTPMHDTSRPTKKRKVTFDGLAPETTGEKNKSARSSTQHLPLEDVSSVGVFATREGAVDTDATIPKRRKPKKKKPEFLVDSVDSNSPATNNIQSEVHDTSRGNPARNSTTANEGDPEHLAESRKPKKKRRASNLDANISVFRQSVDEPSRQMENDDASRPAKKSKKKYSEALDSLGDTASIQPDGNTVDSALSDKVTTPDATQSSTGVKKRAKITDLVTQVQPSDTTGLTEGSTSPIRPPKESSTNPPKTPKSRQKPATVKALASDAPPETEPSKTTHSLTNMSSDAPKKSTAKGKAPSKRSEADHPLGNDKSDTFTQGKTPKKSKNATTQGQPMTSEAVKAATLAAIATVLARKGISTSETPDDASPKPIPAVSVVPALETAEKDKATYRPLQSRTQPKRSAADKKEGAKGVTVPKPGGHLKGTVPSSSIAPQKNKANKIVALQPRFNDPHPTTVDSIDVSQPEQIEGGVRLFAEKEQIKSPAKCPVCNDSPHHTRSRCPIIQAGLRSIRKRLAELKKAEPAGGEETQVIISELETIIEKRSRKPTDKSGKSTQKGDNPSMTAAANQSTAHAVAAALTKVAEAATVSEKVSSKHAFSGIRPSAPSVKPVKPLPIVENDVTVVSPIPSHFLNLGDISSYTDQDLEALIRGPKVGLAAVPDTDTSEEEEQDEQILEEDEEDPQPSVRMGRLQYGDSSDEQEEDSEANDQEGLAVLDRPPSISRSMLEPSEEQMSPTPEELHKTNLSFKDINGFGNSSTELDMTGNHAAREVLDADLSILPGNESTDSSETTPRIPAIIVQSKAAHNLAQQPTPPVEVASQIETDPIEPPEARVVSSQPSQPDPIVSDDDAGPLHSTPKAEVGVRTRSQRDKSKTIVPQCQENLATPALASQTRPDKSNTTGYQSARKTRSLTRLSELPVPPNPGSVRIIKPPHSTNQKKFAQKEEEEEEEEQGSDEIGTQSLLEGKPSPAKTLAKAPKTLAKPFEEKEAEGSGAMKEAPIEKGGKSNTKTPAKGTKTPAKSREGCAKPPPKAATNGPAKPATRTSIRARAAKIMPTSPEPLSVEDVNGTQQTGERSIAAWEVLQQSAQRESEPLIDELCSSLDPSATHAEPAEGATSQEPLFLHSESQQSFPFSQYPDIVQSRKGVTSPVTNDSEDEQEVEASVVKPSAKAAFRSLTEISSQQVNFQPYLRPDRFLMPVEPVIDLYGRTLEEALEQSETESDSEPEKQVVPSHVPKARLAGVVGKR